MLREVFGLLGKDFKSELRNKQAVTSISLYLFSIILVLYYSLMRVDRMTWTGLLWIVLIFLSINTVQGTFSREVRQRHWYLYTLARPLSVYFSKVLYNMILLLGLNALAILLIGLFFNIPVTNWPLFILTMILSTSGISLIFTFISLITAKSGDQAVVMTILATPLIFPILMAGSRLCLVAIELIQDSNYYKDLISIIAMNMITFALSVFLFPILWRD